MQLRSFHAIAALAAFLAVLTLPTGAAPSKPTPAMMKPIQAALVALNTLNASSLNSGVYASDATIVDEFSPYTWSGSNAGPDWINDFIKFANKIHLKNAKGALMPVKYFEQTGDRVYVVVPTSFGGLVNGKPVKETGTWTFTLQRSGSSWFILTESWGKMTEAM